MKIDLTWLLIVAALGLVGQLSMAYAVYTDSLRTAELAMYWSLTAAALIIPAVWIAILYRSR